MEPQRELHKYTSESGDCNTFSSVTGRISEHNSGEMQNTLAILSVTAFTQLTFIACPPSVNKIVILNCTTY